jgi:protein-tyrosine phosphatase
VRIFDWLYLGNYKDASSIEVLRNHKIESILNATIECKNEFPKYFEYKKIPVCDTVKTNIKFYFEDATNFLESCRLKNRKVLVHCYMGISRSSSCILAYLIKYKGYTFESAYLHVKSFKPDIQPNEGFVQQLRQYENEVKINVKRFDLK